MQKNIKVGGSFEIEHKILKYQSKLDDSYRAGNIEKLIFYSNKIKLYNDVHSILNQWKLIHEWIWLLGLIFDSVWNKVKQEVEHVLNDRIKNMIEKRNIMINELLYNMTNLDQPDAIIIHEILLLIPPELKNYLYDNNNENLNKLHKKIIETRSSLRCIKYKDKK
jgi:hypothetical protein